MTDVPLLSVADASEVGVCHVPERARKVLLPVLNAITVFVTRIFSSGWVGLTGVKHSVEVGVFFTVIKRIAIGVVVAWVAGLSRVSVGAVNLNTVADTVVVRIGGRWVGQQRERFIGIVQTVAIGIGTNRAGRGHAVHLCGVGSTRTGANALNGVTRGGGFGDDSVGPVTETRRGPAHGRPGRVHVFHEVVQSVTVGVAVWTVGIGRRGGIEAVCSLPAVRHTVAVGVPTGRVFVDVTVAIVIIGQTIGIPVTVGIRRINESVFVVVKPVRTNVANGVLVTENDAAGSVGARSTTCGLIELHGVLFVPVVDGNGPVPPHTVVEHGGGAWIVPIRGLQVEVFLKVGHAVTVGVGYGTVCAGG